MCIFCLYLPDKVLKLSVTVISYYCVIYGYICDFTYNNEPNSSKTGTPISYLFVPEEGEENTCWVS